jgi:uncharacterized hydrophobic protein (TIGR00271 family)
MFQNLKSLFDLRQDQHDYKVIDASIRAGVRIGGTNLWVLFFAILIASVGLNVNSAAVIIGAMLISPLMRPILGVGYGAAISDFGLIRTSARSLLIFVALSMCTSTLYFLASPLTQPQAELIARTTPTLWDVLIAFFGGCAGIIAQTRREESTVIPGAAIATALMPPLCTSGYGLATANWDFFWGAAYLFAINAFFISLSTFVFVKLMAFPEHERADRRLQRRAHFFIAAGVLALALPSCYLAYGMVREQMFLASSKEVLQEIEAQPGSFILTRDVSVPARRVEVTVGGAPLAPAVQERLAQRLQHAGFKRSSLVVRYVGQEKLDMDALRDQLRKDVYASTLDQLRDRAAKVDELNLQLTKMQAAKTLQGELIQEVLAQYPSIIRMSVADGTVAGRTAVQPAMLAGGAAAPGTAAQAKPSAVTLVLVEASPRLSSDDLQRIQAGMSVRLQGTPVELVQLPEPPAARPNDKRKGKT